MTFPWKATALTLVKVALLLLVVTGVDGWFLRAEILGFVESLLRAT